MAREDIPLSQKFDAFELVSEGIKQLFRLEFTNYQNTMYINNENDVEYMGRLWQSWACTLTDVGEATGGEMNRPKFTIVNPLGVFSTLIAQGYMDGAIITRYRVLMPDLLADVRAYQKQVWRCSKVLSLNDKLAVFELRSLLDGQNFDIPARSFYPPEFPHVSLG